MSGSKFPDNTLSNLDIMKMCKHTPLFRGVYSKDKLPKDRKQGFYIINMQSSHQGDEQGTHWVLLVIGPHCSIYFDSFGGAVPDEIEKYAKKPLIYQEKDCQDLKSSSCGYFCIYMMNKLLETNKKNLSQKFSDVLRSFDYNNLENNEKLILKEKHSY